MSETIESIERGLIMLRGGKDPDRFPITGSAIGKCSREVALQACGVQGRELSARALRVFGMGDISESILVDARVQDLAGSQAITAWEKQREIWTLLPGTENIPKPSGEIPPSLRWDKRGVWIRSRADLVISLVGGALVLEEYKSINGFGFKRVKAEGPEDAYLAQVLCQIRGLIEAGSEVAMSSSIIYQNKDDSELVSFPIDYMSTKNQDLLNARLARMSWIVRAWTENNPWMIPPEFVEHYNPKDGALPWQCNYCMVGPEVGRCLAGANRPDLRLESKPKGDMLQWFARPVL